MKLNLEVLRSEVPAYLESRGLTVFRGRSRSQENAALVEWDGERFPDYRQFVAVAERLDVKLVIFRDQEFHEVLVDATLDDLEETDLPFEDRRDLEQRLKNFRNYSGFACALEMTFEYEASLYCFELKTEWYEEFQHLVDEVALLLEEEPTDDPPLGYFSPN